MPGLKVLQLLNGLNTNSNVQVYTLQNAKEVFVPTRVLVLQPAWVAALVQLPAMPVTTVDRTVILNFLNFLDRFSLPATTYANVKNNSDWRVLYQCDKRALPYVKGTTLGWGAPEDTFPCMQCGVVLPERLMTVDHQRPQAGGELEAVAKVFRVQGLTTSGPKGQKGQAFAANKLTVVPTKFGRTKSPTPDLAQAGRYTLNDLGQTLYSLVYAAGAVPELKTRCMHSLINLAPLCASCNSSKSNLLKC